MNLHDIVYLKSSSEKLMITWIVGVTQNGAIPFDIDQIMKSRPDYQPGDIAVKYGKDKKATIPGNCLIASLSNRNAAIDQVLAIGNVVKHKLSDEEAVVIWVVGQTIYGKTIDLNKLYYSQGFQDGDVVCAYFEKREFKTKLVKAGEVTKIFE